jgi:hypothetical protein
LSDNKCSYFAEAIDKKGGGVMKTRYLVVFSLVVFAVCGFGHVALAQNEVTESFTVSAYATSKLLPLGPNRAYATWESFGVVLSDTGAGLMHGSTVHCIGWYLVDKGAMESEGSCSYTLKDGEKVFKTLKQGGKVGAPTIQGKAKLIGGTGKYAGIQGGTDYTTYFLRPAAEGITQYYTKTKFTYKLP